MSYEYISRDSRQARASRCNWTLWATIWTCDRPRAPGRLASPRELHSGDARIRKRNADAAAARGHSQVLAAAWSRVSSETVQDHGSTEVEEDTEATSEKLEIS